MSAAKGKPGSPAARRRALGLLAAIAMLAAGEGRAFQFRSAVIGNGATPPGGIGDGARSMRATAGQSAIGSGGDGSRTLGHGFWAHGGVLLVGVAPAPTAWPAGATIGLGPPRPNPAAAGTAFAIAIAAPSAVRLEVFDLQGRQVDRVVDAVLAAGVHTAHWSAAVPPGVYLARLTVDGRRVSERRIVVVR